MTKVEKLKAIDGSDLTVVDDRVLYAVDEWKGRFHVTNQYVKSGIDAVLSTPSTRLGFGASFDDRASAEAEVVDIVESAMQVDALNRREIPHHDVKTPSGRADYARSYGEGITFLGTQGHGYYKLDARANAKVDPLLRNKGGWYEMDQEWAKVAFSLPDSFSDRERREAMETLVNAYPDEVSALTGRTIPTEQSWTLRRREFEAMTSVSLVVLSAISAADGMVACVATLAGRRDGSRRDFLVPKDEYERREAFGFVIDEARHEEVVPNAPGM